ncbi:MAG TPA: metal-sulfur cluster assembly factor [Candidatus Norongarragalinales archaeon]|jgi:metal-sulfur cluster biosynthetic enzyme|nr:metal-sulfur cluster assembly factor [Candidatus Norongarragalinales archaeon]
MVLPEKVMETLKTVEDPELKIDIITLGLVYEIRTYDDNTVFVKMTFTSPGCPYGPQLIQKVKQSIYDLGGVKDVRVEVVLDPPWQPSEEVKMMLGMPI